MRTLKLLALLVLAAALRTSAASAQACLGLPSFTRGSVHVNAAGEFPEGVTAYALGIGAGRPDNLFGNLGGGQATFEDYSEKSTFGFLEFGMQLPVSRAQFCPIAGGSFGVGPDDQAAGLEVTTFAATAGLALGIPIGTRAFTVIPNAGARYEYVSQKVDELNVGSFTDTFTAGVADVGLALVFYDRVSIQPLAHIPFYGDDDEIGYGIFASVSFGWIAR